MDGLDNNAPICITFCSKSSHLHILDFIWPLIRSDQISRSIVSDSLRPHELQHTRPPCPSPTPGVYPNSCPSSQRCHPGISSSVVPFSSCPQSLPASGSFPMSQLFAWGGQSTGVSALVSFLPKKSQGYWLDGRESQWTSGVGDGQGSLACCDSRGRKESDTTERLIWSDLMAMLMV